MVVAGLPEGQIDRKSLDDMLATLEAADAHRTFNRIEFFEPYPKQQEFFDLGLIKRERLLMAGNQLGKTECGGVEAAYHLTGLYPPDWLGRRWDRPVKGWAAGETGLLVRDVQQKKLCGEPGVVAALGTGMIPKHLIVDTSLSRGVTDAYDTIHVRHVSGGISVLRFKSYEQGRARFQGDTLDFIWMDEEPPMDIYSECLTRVTATRGMVYVTFTPLKGKSDVVIRYLDEPSPDRAVTIMTIMDVLHISPEERDMIIAGYPAHEREARVSGVPMLGEGRIFPYADAVISEPPIEYIPQHWGKLWSIDFGIGHPFAAVLNLWDRDNNVIHVHHAIRAEGQLPLNHARAMMPIGGMVPVAWPQDGTAREKSTGETLASAYKAEKLLMLPDHATWPDGGISTEAGIMEMQKRMTTEKYKVASHLSPWFDEFRTYHRKDGLIVKVKDDLMSASRIGVMAIRHARNVALGGRHEVKRRSPIAQGMDFSVF